MTILPTRRQAKIWYSETQPGPATPEPPVTLSITILRPDEIRGASDLLHSLGSAYQVSGSNGNYTVTAPDYTHAVGVLDALQFAGIQVEYSGL